MGGGTTSKKGVIYIIRGVSTELNNLRRAFMFVGKSRVIFRVSMVSGFRGFYSITTVGTEHISYSF